MSIKALKEAYTARIEADTLLGTLGQLGFGRAPYTGNSGTPTPRFPSHFYVEATSPRQMNSFGRKYISRVELWYYVFGTGNLEAYRAAYLALFDQTDFALSSGVLLGTERTHNHITPQEDDNTTGVFRFWGGHQFLLDLTY